MFGNNASIKDDYIKILTLQIQFSFDSDNQTFLAACY